MRRQLPQETASPRVAELELKWRGLEKQAKVQRARGDLRAAAILDDKARGVAKQLEMFRNGRPERAARR